MKHRLVAALVAAKVVRQLSAVGVPEPQCRTKIRLLPLPLCGQVCVPAYCREASDHASCESANGPDSKLQCCVTPVLIAWSGCST